MTGFDAVARWPELFEGVDEDTRDDLRQVLAIDYLAGGEPDREITELLVSYATGLLSAEEYVNRARELFIPPTQAG